MPRVKILVCGDVDGDFKTLFTRVAEYHAKKGPFEYLFCVGNFFGKRNEQWGDVSEGKIKVPLPTFILGPTKIEHVRYYPKYGDEMAPNLYFIGKLGIFTGACRLKVAYISGLEKEKSNDICFSKGDLTRLFTGIGNDKIDVLLTSDWPQGVTKYTEDPNAVEYAGSITTAYVAKHLKPRYHFSGYGGVFYQRASYRNHQVLQEKPMHNTQFFGLASLANGKKKTKENKFKSNGMGHTTKWICAFDFYPLLSEDFRDLTLPGPVTECPYIVNDSRNLDMIKDIQNQFFYDTSTNQKRVNDDDPQCSSSKKQTLSVSQDKCWFCFTNPNLEKQLLVSIGDDSYITLAKGGIVDDHLLVVPMEHVLSFIQLPEAVANEMLAFKNALVKYFHNNGKDVIFYERNYRSPHLQLQCVPIPKSKSVGIMDNIHELGASHGLEFIKLSRFTMLKKVVPPKKPYFFIEAFVNQENVGAFIHIIEKNFPLQFGRLVLASQFILDKPDRVDWKKCQRPLSEELEIADNLRKDFGPYELTSD